MSRASQAESIFFAALDKKSAGERDDYLDQACGTDATLRLRVQRLLDAHPLAEDFLAQPAIDRDEFDPIDPAGGARSPVSVGGSEAIPPEPTEGTGLLEQSSPATILESGSIASGGATGSAHTEPAMTPVHPGPMRRSRSRRYATAHGRTMPAGSG